MKRPKRYPENLEISLAPMRSFNGWEFLLRINGQNVGYYRQREQAQARIAIFIRDYQFSDRALYNHLKIIHGGFFVNRAHYVSYTYGDGEVYEEIGNKHGWINKDEIDFIEDYEARHGQA